MQKIKTIQAIQNGLGITKSDGKLKNIWLELPGYCNLACSYCYADGGKPEKENELLKIEDYKRILSELNLSDVKKIGIPGAGEPFHQKNKDLTMMILDECQKSGIYVTLFTTGEFITSELADRLYDLPVELMLKGNSLDPNKQDLFVSNPKLGRIIHGYGKKRNETLDLLIKKGFTDQTKWQETYGRDSRVALVTSIMTNVDGDITNYDEISSILKYCREQNIIFDVDSVLKRGRGASCDLCEDDERLKSKLLELQKIDSEVYGINWELSQSYVGSVCDRFSYHLYVNQYGDIRPCIGTMDVNLGNIKKTTLNEAWNHPAMKIIKKRNYKGKCGDECANFTTIDEEKSKEAEAVKYKCNSCLGRRTENLTTENIIEKGYVQTIGCWNHKPK